MKTRSPNWEEAAAQLAHACDKLITPLDRWTDNAEDEGEKKEAEEAITTAAAALEIFRSLKSEPPQPGRILITVNTGLLDSVYWTGPGEPPEAYHIDVDAKRVGEPNSILRVNYSDFREAPQELIALMPPRESKDDDDPVSALDLIRLELTKQDSRIKALETRLENITPAI